MYTTLQAAMAGGEQVFNLLDTVPEVQDQPGAIDLPPLIGRVVLDHVSFRYRPELPDVLHDINLKIAPGQTVALVGPTGAGKTLFLIRSAESVYLIRKEDEYKSSASSRVCANTWGKRHNASPHVFLQLLSGA